MVDETVLGGVVLGLERAEEGLLGTKDLDGTGGVLGKVHQTTGVTNQSGTDKLTDKGGKVGSDGLHAVAEVFGELGAVLGDGDDLVTERVDVGHVRIRDFGTHRKLGGGFEGSLEVFGKEEREVGGNGVGSETYGSG